MEIMFNEKEVALIEEGLNMLIKNAEWAKKFECSEDIDEYIQCVSDLYDKVYKAQGETLLQYPVGHEMSCTLKNGDVITLIVTESTDQYVRFECKEIFDCMYINKDQTKTGGIAKSDMAEYLNTAFLPLLPDDLQEAISVTTRSYMDGCNEKAYKTKIFIPDASEVFGSEVYNLYEQLDYYKESKNRIRTFFDKPMPWWLATQFMSYSTIYCSSNVSGEEAAYGAESKVGVVPCFIIKWSDFCKENGFQKNSVDYVERK